MSQASQSRPLDRRDVGDVTVLRITRPMLQGDAETEAQFQQAFAVVQNEGRGKLVLDLRDVAFMGSAALGLMIMLMHKANRAGGRLALSRVPRPVAELMRISRVSDILIGYTDEEEAIASFR